MSGPSEGENAIAVFAARRGLVLDPFQVQAMEHLSAGRSVLLCAPTGTGKTLVAEFAIFRALRRGERIVYTTPLKALSNQQYRHLRNLLATWDLPGYQGPRVGLVTGDVTLDPEAPVILATTEIFRNWLLESDSDSGFPRRGTVIFDEVHYLADHDRGTVWEESLLLTPNTWAVLALSATVPNAREIAAWLRTRGRDLVLVEHQERAVPLEHRVLRQGRLQPLPPPRPKADDDRPGGRLSLNLPSGAAIDEAIEPWEVVRALAADDLLPAIYFRFGRRAVEVAAESCARLRLLNGAAARAAADTALTRLEALVPGQQTGEQVDLLRRLLPRGVAFHHGGMLPQLRALVEELFAGGLLRVVCATDTLALGINAPARAVVVGDLTKFDGQSRRPLLPNEYYQLAGRAGRRGLDALGVAVVPLVPGLPEEPQLAMVRQPLLPLESAFRPGYPTFLALWSGPDDAERVARFLAESLQAFQARDHASAFAPQWVRRRDNRWVRREGQPHRGRSSGERQHLARYRAEVRARRQVLEHFGYLHLGRPTRRARFLRHLSGDRALPLAEVVLGGWLDSLAPAELAEVLTWFAFDRGSRHRLALTPRLSALRLGLGQLLLEVGRLEARYDLALTEPIEELLSGVGLAWTNGSRLALLAERTGMAEGDLVAGLQQSLELANQLRFALGRRHPLTPALADAENLILRDEVLAAYGDLAPFLRVQRDPSDAHL
ncbi:MAG: DEAD/DEAH box helicase [Chloroflexi bacterium]|nr:DEAD/DEAH box helicase [Chloroflexota bacterium]